jgi:hypothetical protein
MLEPFHGFHFGHALSKVCQYVITNDKMVHRLNYTFIKAMQINIQKCITWFKILGKGKKRWDKTCIDFKLKSKKFNTPMRAKYVLDIDLLKLM